MGIKQWMLTRFISGRTAQINYQSSHKCNNCQALMKPVHRMSILNLLVYLVVAILAGILIKWYAGPAVFLLCAVIDFARLPKVCGKCFSENIEKRDFPDSLSGEPGENRDWNRN